MSDYTASPHNIAIHFSRPEVLAAGHDYSPRPGDGTRYAVLQRTRYRSSIPTRIDIDSDICGIRLGCDQIVYNFDNVSLINWRTCFMNQ